jgi:RNA polymerase sigma factor (sigma-70 family)
LDGVVIGLRPGDAGGAPTSPSCYRAGVDTDVELLDKWCAGDKQAGQALLVRHFDTLVRFFDAKVEHEADDLVQRTMLACVASKDRFRRESSFRTYLFTIARHELFRYLRGKRRDGERLDFSVTSIAEILTTPASRMIRDADRQRIRDALCQLPVDDQDLVELFYWHDMQIEELSQVFDLTPVTTRVRLHRARKKLGELLGEDEVEMLEKTRDPESKTTVDLKKPATKNGESSDDPETPKDPKK